MAISGSQCHESAGRQRRPAGLTPPLPKPAAIVLYCKYTSDNMVQGRARFTD